MLLLPAGDADLQERVLRLDADIGVACHLTSGYDRGVLRGHAVAVALEVNHLNKKLYKPEISESMDSGAAPPF